MTTDTIDIIKSSGEKTKFSLDKLRTSLKRTGASHSTISHIISTVTNELYQGITTKEIYNRAFALLKKKKSYLASKYKLKKAIYELGPTGFPFERFVAEILKYSGYEVEVGKILQGKCVTHEIDIIAHKNNETTIIECKFHGEPGLNCNVKIPKNIIINDFRVFRTSISVGLLYFFIPQTTIIVKSKRLIISGSQIVVKGSIPEIIKTFSNIYSINPQNSLIVI